VATGFEPVYTALQAVASPLGHATVSPRSDPLRADDGIRTRDPHLGKVMRYQLRYVRNARWAPPKDSPLRQRHPKAACNPTGQTGAPRAS
jgi:hypothetical protein